MAAIAHAFTEQNTPQTTTSVTYSDVTGASIASGNFTTGKKYLLIITAQSTLNTADDASAIRTLHGSTAFDESEQIQETETLADYGIYQFITVWTAVSGEGIKLQFRPLIDTLQVTIDQIAMFAMNLSDDLTENTDWFFAERATDDTLNIAFTDGAAVTFTPGTAGHDWLVLSYSQIDITSGTLTAISRLSRSGEASSLLPEARGVISLTTAVPGFLLSRVFNLGASSNTFTEQSASDTDATHTRLHSSIFALNLNKFKNHANAYTEADVALSATDYATQLQTISITPDVVSDTLIGSYCGFDGQSTLREFEFRVQLDEADQPTGQTTDNRQFAAGNNDTDENPCPLITMVTALSAAAHTIDLDGSVDNTAAASAAQHRTLWAVTMELAAGSNPPDDPYLGLRSVIGAPMFGGAS